MRLDSLSADGDMAVVGVGSSSIADEFWASCWSRIREAATRLSEALEGLRSCCWRATGLGFGGGIDMLARSTSPMLVPGSAERPLRLAEGDEAPESECDP